MQTQTQRFRRHYDAIIVGARCAGAATAMLLARAGMDVLVVDHDAPGTDTMSTHALMRGAVSQLARWGLLGELRTAGTPPVTATSFIYADGRVDVDIRPSGGVDALFAPRRTVLDPLLAKAAVRAGASLEYGTSLRGLVRDRAGRVIGARLRTACGQEVEVSARIVIGADGRRSAVARQVEAPTLAACRHASAVAYSYFAGLPDNAYRWFWQDKAAGGAIPTNDGLSCVFVAVPASEYRQMADVMAGEGIAGFARARIPELGTLLGDTKPMRSPVFFRGDAGHLRASAGPGWALVGDAAYFKDPLTAHGISDALRDAEILARAIIGGRVEDYPALRDELCRGFFEVTGKIASFQWDMAEIRDLHVQLNRESKSIQSWTDFNFSPMERAA
ncbi:MAG: NAD(P)/FAD-dependent oxidoreductase [Nitratireductor sp.]|nr:NAD(P)/FAD-dependent oxidoreductase [Nitratireductor sp.]